MINDSVRVQKLLHQQAAIASFGSFAFRQGDLTKVLTEAARICAEGLNAPLSKVCTYRAAENDLLIEAGHGWRTGVIGYACRADETTPQGRAFITRKPSICADLRKDHDFVLPPFYAEYGIVSTIDVIIKGEGEIYGILEIDSVEQHDYDQHDIDFLTGFANVLAEAVAIFARTAILQTTIAEKDQLLHENKILAEGLQQKARKQTALAQFSVKTIETDNLPAVLAQAANQICETLDVEHCSIIESDTLQNSSHLISTSGITSEPCRTQKLSDFPERSLIHFILKSGVSIRFSNIERESRFDLNPGIQELGVKSGLGILATGSANINVLVYVFCSRVREFTDGETAFLQTFGNMIRAVTEKERVQNDIRARDEHMRQAQKMEALGQLTGGVAHDFNNTLTVILGNAGLLVEKLIDNAHLCELANLIESAAIRGAVLTSQLLAYVRQQPLAPKIVNINDLLVSMNKLLRYTLNEDIEIEFVRGPDLWNAMVDPSLLEGALLNFVINGRDAMPDGGQMTIETANVWLDQDYADRNTEVTAGPYVMISVSDVGIGIPAENIDRVFDPFFTTKGVGRGTGLGLSMVYGFVKQSHGHIKIYSEVKHGTTVKMYLPRTEREHNVVEEAPPFLPTQEGTEKVLVVEDDNFVRDHTANQLRRLGYEVLAVDNGPNAIEALRQNADFDLMFTDMIMPGGMNGRQLAEAAIKLRPSLKVLYTSGYAEKAIIHQGLLDTPGYLLNKPYRLNDLARKVRAVLSGRKE